MVPQRGWGSEAGPLLLQTRGLCTAARDPAVGVGFGACQGSTGVARGFPCGPSPPGKVLHLWAPRSHRAG